MFSSYHLKIVDFYNIPIRSVEELVPSFLIKKGMYSIMKPYNFI